MDRKIQTALYLDVDMLVCADIRSLWTLDLENISAGVVLDWCASHCLTKKILILVIFILMLVFFINEFKRILAKKTSRKID